MADHDIINLINYINLYQIESISAFNFGFIMSENPIIVI